MGPRLLASHMDNGIGKGLQDNLLSVGGAPVLGADHEWRQQVEWQKRSSSDMLPPGSGRGSSLPDPRGGVGAVVDQLASDTPPPRRRCCCCSVRSQLIGVLLFGIFCQTAVRSVPSFVFNGDDGMAAELGYSNTQRGAILSAFGWAYTVMQLPAGFLSQTFGPKRTLLVLVSLGFVAGLLMPLVAERASFVGPLILNGVIGLSQGGTFPISNGVMAVWLSVDELGRGNGLLGAFWHLGQVFQFLVSPLLLKLRIGEWEPGGWRLAWYFYGGVGLVWSVLWCWAGGDSPTTHPRITREEREEIARCQSLALRKPRRRQFSEAENQLAAEAATQPSQFDLRLFGRICRQRTVIAMAVCSMLDGAAGAYANWMPQYYNSILEFDLGSTGILVALPLLIGFAAAVIGGLCADAMMARGFRTTPLRRWFNCLPSAMMAACTFGMILARGTSQLDRGVAIGLQNSIYFINGFKQAGLGPIPMDISQKYADIVMGVFNTAGNLMYYALANNIIGLWLDYGRCQSDVDDQNPPTPEDTESCRVAWVWLFVTCGGLYLLSALVFALFVSAERIDHLLDRRPPGHK